MSAGTGDTITLYDAQGNPVTVQLVGGSYAIVTHDEEVQQTTAELLTEIRDELRMMRQFMQQAVG